MGAVGETFEVSNFKKGDYLTNLFIAPNAVEEIQHGTGLPGSDLGFCGGENLQKDCWDDALGDSIDCDPFHLDRNYYFFPSGSETELGPGSGSICNSQEHWAWQFACPNEGSEDCCCNSHEWWEMCTCWSWCEDSDKSDNTKSYKKYWC